MDEPRKERRRAPRRRLARPLPCRVGAGPDATAGALLVDLSRVGLSVVLNAPLPRHTVLCVELPGGEAIMARVARVARERDGTWLHGCDLMDPLPPGTVEGLAP